jgi:hypothetical protein
MKKLGLHKVINEYFHVFYKPFHRSVSNQCGGLSAEVVGQLWLSIIILLINNKHILHKAIYSHFQMYRKQFHRLFSDLKWESFFNFNFIAPVLHIVT